MKADLLDHRKFLRLVRLVDEPKPLVVGLLMFMWRRGYQTGNPLLGDALDVEAAAEYQGEPGKFTKAALDAGFLDVDDRGRYSIHDLWDHAPVWAKKRMTRNGFGPKSTPTPKVKPRTNGIENAETRPERETNGTKKGKKQPAWKTKSKEERGEKREEREEEELPAVAGHPSADEGGRNPHRRAVSLFCEKWQAKYGVKYPFAGGKHGDAVKWMLAQCGGEPENLAPVFDRFLADADKFYAAESRHDLTALRQHFPRWLVARSPPANAARPNAYAVIDVIPPPTPRQPQAAAEVANDW